MPSDPATELPVIIDKPPITTSEQVVCLARDRKSLPKLKHIAEAWGLSPIDIFTKWYPMGHSKNFLTPLAELSDLMSDGEKAQQLLIDCKEERTKGTRGSAKRWAVADVKQAISRAKELGLGHNTSSTNRPKRTVTRVQKTQAAVPNIDEDTPRRRTRKRARVEDNFDEAFESRESDLDETPAHVTSRSTGLIGVVDSPERPNNDPVGVLVNSLERCGHTSGRRKARPVTTPGAGPCRVPPTPISATLVDQEHCSADHSTPWSSPSQPAQAVEKGCTVVSNTDQQAMEEDSTGHYDAANPSNGAESAEETRQPFPCGGAQPEWTNDDRVDIILQTYNRDPSTWYVVPTQIVQADGAVGDMLPEFRDAESSPKMVLIPLRGADGAQRTLILFDRMQAHGTVFDAGGCDQFATMAWSTAQTLLTQIGILHGEASMDLQPLPSVHLNEGVNHGVLLVIAALHKLHKKPIDRVSPRLWRGLLAGFFHDGRDPPQKRLERLLADLTKLTSSEVNEAISVEQNTDDAEALNRAKKTVQSYAEQSRLLLEMTGSQLRSGEERKKVAKAHEWLLARPSDTDIIGSELATLETKVVSQLGTLPEIPEWCEGQLRSIRTSCQYVVDECEQAAHILEARCDAMVETADASLKRLGVRLGSLRT
jgi:hypothetical protein